MGLYHCIIYFQGLASLCYLFCWTCIIVSSIFMDAPSYHKFAWTCIIVSSWTIFVIFFMDLHYYIAVRLTHTHTRMHARMQTCTHTHYILCECALERERERERVRERENLLNHFCFQSLDIFRMLQASYTKEFLECLSGSVVTKWNYTWSN